MSGDEMSGGGGMSCTFGESVRCGVRVTCDITASCSLCLSAVMNHDMLPLLCLSQPALSSVQYTNSTTLIRYHARHALTTQSHYTASDAPRTQYRA